MFSPFFNSYESRRKNLLDASVILIQALIRSPEQPGRNAFGRNSTFLVLLNSNYGIYYSQEEVELLSSKLFQEIDKKKLKIQICEKTHVKEK